MCFNRKHAKLIWSKEEEEEDEEKDFAGWRRKINSETETTKKVKKSHRLYVNSFKDKKNPDF